MEFSQSESEKSANVQRANTFLNLGFKDYVAARILLLNRMLLQGAGMASTAVEKYFKGYAAYHGHNLKRHIDEGFIQTLKNGPGIPPSVSENFLEFLGKCYKLRYFDNIPSGYNLCIRQRQLLAELDEAVLAFEKSFHLLQDGIPSLTSGQYALKAGEPAVTTENWIANNQKKSDFIEQLDLVYEIRFLETSRQIEINYSTTSGKNDGDFLKDGFIQLSPTEFQCTFLPIP